MATSTSIYTASLTPGSRCGRHREDPPDGANRGARWGLSGDGGGEIEGSTIRDKTHEFFQICDIEDKGFITRRDMQRLHGELPLSADELENVFDTLDLDGNGYLTLDEFSSGFSEFIFGQRPSAGGRMGEASPCETVAETLYQSQWEEQLAGSEDDEEKHFCMLMDSLGASNVFEEWVKTSEC